MRATKAAIAIDPQAFGRKIYVHKSAPVARPSITADLKLFASTFAAGFLFVSIFLA